MSFLDILRVIRFIWPFIKEIVFVGSKERARSITTLLIAFILITIFAGIISYWNFSPYRWIENSWGISTHTSSDIDNAPKNSTDSETQKAPLEQRFLQKEKLVDQVKEDNQRLRDSNQLLQNTINHLRRENNRLRDLTKTIKNNCSGQQLNPKTKERLENYYE